MSVIDDITAILTPVLHTNTTKDITAAAVKTALISAFTDVVNDEIARAAANTTAINNAIGSVPAVARQAEPVYDDLLASTGLRAGEVKFGIQNYGATGSYGTLIDKTIDSTGTISDSNYMIVTDFMLVEPGTQLTISDPWPGASALVWYDSSKTYLSNTPSGGTWTHGQVVTVPAGAFFLRWSMPYWSPLPTVHITQILRGNISTANIKHKWKSYPATLSMVRPWTGRRWFAAGDSMLLPSATDSQWNTWFSDVARYHGCVGISNQSRAGGDSTTIMDKWNRPTDYTRVPLVSGDFTNMDAVLVQVGANDRTIGTTVGTISDATTAGTYFGNIKKFVEFVLTSNPSTKIILSTSLGDMTNDSVAAGILPYRQAIRDICDFYGLHLWDIAKQAQWSRFSHTFYSGDNLHMSHPQWPLFDGVHTPVAADIGMKQVWASNFAAYMHTVFPSDFMGDAIYGPRPNVEYDLAT